MRRVILLPLTLILWVVSFVLYLFGGFHWVVNLLKPYILGKTPLGGDNLYPIGIFPWWWAIYHSYVFDLFHLSKLSEFIYQKKKKKNFILPTSGINLVSEFIFRYQTPKPLPHQSLVKDCKLPIPKPALAIGVKPIPSHQLMIECIFQAQLTKLPREH